MSRHVMSCQKSVQLFRFPNPNKSVGSIHEMREERCRYTHRGHFVAGNVTILVSSLKRIPMKMDLCF